MPTHEQRAAQEQQERIERIGKSAHLATGLFGDVKTLTVVIYADETPQGIKLLTPVAIRVPYQTLLQTAANIILTTPMVGMAAPVTSTEKPT